MLNFKNTLTTSSGLVALAAIAISGCTMLGPEFETPQSAVANSWRISEEKEISSTATDLADWWTVFGDDTLISLVESSINQNLPLRIAGVRIFEARAQLGIASGRFYPQNQGVGGGLTHVELSENQPNGFPQLDNSFRDLELGFDAAWELDFWGRFRRGIEAAGSVMLAEIAAYDDALVSLTAEVANSYIALRTFEARLAIARQNVAIQKRSLEVATTRFEHGATSGLDVEQATTLLANTQASIPSLEIGLHQAQNAISILLGLPPGDLDRLAANTAAIPPPPEALTVGIPADLLRRRPDIRRAELQAAAQSAIIGVTEAELYPQFSLAGSVGLRASDTGSAELSDLFDGSSLQASIGPSFRWNILNYGRIKNAVRVEDARFQQSLIDYQNTVLQAAREVEDALIAFVRGKERLGFLDTSVASAERSVDLALIQYREGAVDYTRVLDTQTALAAQQDELTAAQGQVIRDLIAAYKALGGGWQVRESRGVLPEGTASEMGSRTDWGKLLRTDAPEVPAADIRKPDW